MLAFKPSFAQLIKKKTYILNILVNTRNKLLVRQLKLSGFKYINQNRYFSQQEAPVITGSLNCRLRYMQLTSSIVPHSARLRPG